LHYATVRGRLDSVYALLSCKPDLTYKTVEEGNTALHHLFLKNSTPAAEKRDILVCLLEHENGYRSNEVNIQDLHGQTALHLALQQSEIADKAILEYLWRIVDVSIADENGATALHLALECGASQEVISALLGNNQGAVAANMRDGEGNTPLQDALLLDNMDAALAIARIADVNIPDSDGKTALHYAVELEEHSFLHFLLHERNADLLLRDHQGYTPLAVACSLDTVDSNSQLSLIYQLCQYGVAYGNLQSML